MEARSRVLLSHLVLGAVLLAGSASAGMAPPCAGDCEADGDVIVAEIVRGVLLRLGGTSVNCGAFEPPVEEETLVAAVDHALAGCPRAPTPTPTSTGTPTNTPTPGPSSRDCGNAATEPGEECDDGNRLGGDGCDANCRLEGGPDRCAGVDPVAGTNLTAVRVARGLSNPLYATAPPRDFSRLFILEQRGRIRILRDGEVLPTPFLDLTSRVVAGGELGLLGLAFHPHYESNGEFFVDYTTRREEGIFSVVSRFRVSADPDRADAASEEIILEQAQPYIAHNGGQLAFDPAGYFYVSFGDGGLSGSVQNSAQDPDTWLGKILRIDVDGGTPYAIPTDNPFVGPDGIRDEIWVMGLRNPWRFSFDPVTGVMYIGDVGDGSREEVDVVPPDGGGLNFGWCCREGSTRFARCFRAATTCPMEGLTDPLLEYEHPTGCSVTGGYVYRGCALPDLRGTYFYADYCKAFVRSARYEDGAFVDERDWTLDLTPAGGATIDAIAGFGEDGRGELYLCDLGGEVYKIVPADEGSSEGVAPAARR